MPGPAIPPSTPKPPPPSPEDIASAFASAGVQGKTVEHGLEVMVQSILAGLRSTLPEGSEIPEAMIEELRKIGHERVMPAIQQATTAAIPPEFIKRLKASIKPPEPEPVFPLLVSFVEPVIDPVFIQHYGAKAAAPPTPYFMPWDTKTGKHLGRLLEAEGVELPKPDPRIARFMPPDLLFQIPLDVEPVLLKLEAEDKVKIGEKIKGCLFPRGTMTALREGKVLAEITDEDLTLLVHLGCFSSSRRDAPEWLKPPAMEMKDVTDDEGNVVGREPQTLKDHGLDRWPDETTLLTRGVDARIAVAICRPQPLTPVQQAELKAAWSDSMNSGKDYVQSEVIEWERQKMMANPEAVAAAMAEAGAERQLTEQERKVKLFQDVLTGGLYWLAQKAQGAPPAWVGLLMSRQAQMMPYGPGVLNAMMMPPGSLGADWSCGVREGPVDLGSIGSSAGFVSPEELVAGESAAGGFGGFGGLGNGGEGKEKF